MDFEPLRAAQLMLVVDLITTLGSDTAWGDPATYDLMLCTDRFGRDFAAEMLAHAMRG